MDVVQWERRLDALTALCAACEETVRPTASTTVPARAYLDPEAHEATRRACFGALPRPIALAGDVREPGDHLALRVARHPVLLWRRSEAAGAHLHAYVNACAHRGMPVSEGRGRGDRLLCPHHDWCYRDDGWLESVPADHDLGPRDRSQYGLVPLACTEQAGLVWATPQPTPDSDTSDPQASSPIRALAGLDLQDLDLASLMPDTRGQRSIALPWSLAWDLARERGVLAASVAAAMQSNSPSPAARTFRLDAAGQGLRLIVRSPQPEGLTSSTLEIELVPGSSLLVFAGGAVLQRIEPGLDPTRSDLKLATYASAPVAPPDAQRLADAIEERLQQAALLAGASCRPDDATRAALAPADTLRFEHTVPCVSTQS